MKNFCSKWKYELVCILMELLQGKSITSVIKGIVHLTVMRNGPTLHVSVVLQSFYFKSFLLFRRTEAGFESRKEFSRTFFFFVKKKIFPNLCKSGSVSPAVLSLHCVRLSTPALSVLLKRLSFKSHSSAQASYSCAHVTASESLRQKHFPFQDGLWASAQNGLQSWYVYSGEELVKYPSALPFGRALQEPLGEGSISQVRSPRRVK